MVRTACALSIIGVAAAVANVGPVTNLFTSGVSELPWSKGQEVCYRIPALLRTSGGTLLALASERLGSTCNDELGTNVVMRRSTDNGATWEPAQLILATGEQRAEMSPWALQDASTGRIFLFTNTNVKSPDCNCEVFHITSDDDGKTWSDRTVVPASSGFYGSALTTGITHSKSGRLVGCMRKICRNSCPHDYASKAFFSEDHGATWSASDFLASGTTECQVAELSDGRLYMNMRPLNYTGTNTSGTFHNRRLKSFSSDAGSTWSAAEDESDLIDFGFADEGSVVSDPANKVLYFSHPQAHDRSNLTLYTSVDDSSSWSAIANVYSGAAAYSSIAIMNPSPGKATDIGVLFERDGYGALAFASVSTSSDPLLV